MFNDGSLILLEGTRVLCEPILMAEARKPFSKRLLESR